MKTEFNLTSQWLTEARLADQGSVPRLSSYYGLPALLVAWSSVKKGNLWVNTEHYVVNVWSETPSTEFQALPEIRTIGIKLKKEPMMTELQFIDAMTEIDALKQKAIAALLEGRAERAANRKRFF